MRSIYNSNLNYLNLNIRNKLNKIKLPEDLELITTKSQDLTIKLYLDNKELFLHSKYDPKKEAERFISEYRLDQYGSLILIGFALGYHVETILNKLKSDQRLKIVITNPYIFKVALENRDLTNILKDERLEMILELNPDELISNLKNSLENLSSKNSKLLVHPQSLKSIPKEMIFLKDILEEIKISQYNNKRLKSAIRDNIINNIDFIDVSVGVKSFKNAFIDKPIFIVAAGPSLDKNISRLKKIGTKGIIISVDTALTVLTKEGISPDFIISNEPNERIYKMVFKNLPNMDIPLVYSLGTTSKLIKNYKGPKILGLSKDDLLTDKIEKFIDKGRIKTGGTVAIAALDFAYKLGGNPIICVGQDFAFAEDGMTHASSTFYGNRKKDKSLLRRIEGIYGDFVYTDTNYYLYLREFERYISTQSDRIYIDATEGGAKIIGTEIMTLLSAINNFCKEFINKEEIINNIIQAHNFREYNTHIEEIKRIIKEEI
ncbi:hypothetical protein U472_03525 [Orenia metallireducens]|uniref:6-hydroxymethylpterin diphosphokinase MptE-like domain-containing protein n=1 Tax=Orenia metallireducens TaxID=1413210 RepID=A0A1C0AB82_9FIRM|nr:6-hydroxymethylpterin diphosphokinase MptE-like protein [Orenia metallireducens]OCL27632.1 hypothetical protein U472_03525 [Orenia metallireducens]